MGAKRPTRLYEGRQPSSTVGSAMRTMDRRRDHAVPLASPSEPRITLPRLSTRGVKTRAWGNTATDNGARMPK